MDVEDDGTISKVYSSLERSWDVNVAVCEIPIVSILTVEVSTVDWQIKLTVFDIKSGISSEVWETTHLNLLVRTESDLIVKVGVCVPETVIFWDVGGSAEAES